VESVKTKKKRKNKFSIILNIKYCLLIKNAVKKLIKSLMRSRKWKKCLRIINKILIDKELVKDDLILNHFNFANIF
jgi:hypothetical protein